MTSVQSEKFPKKHPNTTAVTSGFAGHTLQDTCELRPVIKFSFTKTLISYKTPSFRADLQVSNFRLNICYIYKVKHLNIGLPHCKFIRFVHYAYATSFTFTKKTCLLIQLPENRLASKESVRAGDSGINRRWIPLHHWFPTFFHLCVPLQPVSINCMYPSY